MSNGAMMSVVPFVTGRTCGDGGIERPRRGVRLVELLREPGMGGRRRGAGADMVDGREVERLELLLDARMDDVLRRKLVVLLDAHGFGGRVWRRLRFGGQDRTGRWLKVEVGTT